MTAKEISSQLIKDIADGMYAEAGRLPSETKLSESFGVSRMTLRVALDKLRQLSLIEKRNGAGSFLTKRAFRSSRLIGLVIPNFGKFSFFAEIKSEIERRAVHVGYRIKLISTQACETEAIVRDIRRKTRQLAIDKAEGIIFRPFISGTLDKANQEIISIFRHVEVPVVLIDSDVARPPKRSDCDLVAIDNIGAGRVIANHLHERGYRHVAFLVENKDPFAIANWGNRFFGLAGELALLGYEDSVRQLKFDPTDERAVQALFRSRRQPDAIVCGNDEKAALLLATLTRIGKHVPNDVAVVGFDDIPLARSTVPPLTTISQPIKKLAATAFKTLLARIRYPNNDPREILLNAPLVVRRSTSP